MTTTATKGYTLPVVGADFNSWGTELNGNFSIIDNNLGGINSNSMAASSGSTYTVTSAAAQNVIQQMTGTITGAVTYQMPAQQGFWLIDNNCSGAFDVIITSAGGGTSVIAPPGVASILIWSDATNIMTIGRTVLGATLNLFVSTGGSDSNSGYTSGTAFLTLQHAANVAQNNYDTQGNNIIVNVANGTYTAGVTQIGPLVGGGILEFLGNTGTPASCAVTMGSTGSCFFAQYGARLTVSGFQLTQSHGTNAGTPGCGLQASLGGVLLADHITFGACQYAHIAAEIAGYVQMTSSTNYTISGAAQFHMISGGAGGQIIALNLTSPSVTLSGTPAFTAFLAADMGFISVNGTTWSGSATGLKYSIADGGYILTGGASASLPGTSSSGATLSGGFVT
jgi:hypothetical protein